MLTNCKMSSPTKPVFTPAFNAMIKSLFSQETGKNLIRLNKLRRLFILHGAAYSKLDNSARLVAWIAEYETLRDQPGWATYCYDNDLEEAHIAADLFYRYHNRESEE
jgi:hypothetical protein